MATSRVALSETIFLAQQAGLFQQEGLDVTLTLTTSGREALDLMLEGKADMSSAASVPITSAIMNGAKPVLLATVCKSDTDSSLVARSDRGITSAEDLAGKTVAVAFRTGAHIYLHNLLIDAGVSPRNVHIIDMSPEDAASALVAGKIDATVQFFPWDIRSAEAIGPEAVVSSPHLYNVHWIISANRDFLLKHPDTASRLLRALHAAEKLAEGQPKRSAAITAEAIGVTVEELSQRRDNYKCRISLPQSMIVTLENDTRWYAALNTGKSESAAIPNYLQYIDAKPLKQVLPNTVRFTE